jgi:hypothetical protein
MTTRAGTNRFSGSVYDTWRNQAGTTDADLLARTKHPKWLWGLNTPYWFNKRDRPKTAAGDYFIDDVRLETPGFRVGGPIFKDKMFYFFNSEWFLLPQTVARTRNILTTNAQAGLFTYPAADGSGNQTVNLYSIAGGAPDPTIAKLLADIRAAALTTGNLDVRDENTQKFNYNPAATQKRVFPTLRLDYNLTSAHRLTFTTRYNMFRSDPDFLNNAEPAFPGFPIHGAQNSDRWMWQGTLRSTIGKNMVNRRASAGRRGRQGHHVVQRHECRCIQLLRPRLPERRRSGLLHGHLDRGQRDHECRESLLQLRAARAGVGVRRHVDVAEGQAQHQRRGVLQPVLAHAALRPLRADARLRSHVVGRRPLRRAERRLRELPGRHR